MTRRFPSFVRFTLSRHWPGFFVLSIIIFLGGNHTGVEAAWGDTFTDVTNIQAAVRGGLYTGNRAPLAPSPLLRLTPGSIQPQGWLLTVLQNQRNGLNGLQEQISPFLQFATSDWTTTNGSGATQGWERVPYWLRGYIDLGYSLQDATVISNSTHWIKGVMLSQRTNGYFGPATDYSDGTAAVQSDIGPYPDLWPAMPMLDAFRSYYDYTGDTNALNLMLKYCLWESTLPGSDFGTGYWPMMRMGDNIDSIYWLYNRTGESWLLNLATNIYANMARWDTPNTLPNWHNVNIAECFRAPTVFWQQSSNATHLAFAEANYQTVMSQYGQVPGGAFGGDEVCRTGYYGPRQAFETCGWVELMRSFEILNRITGNPVWAERCEDAAANSYPAALRTNMLSLHYLTAPNQPETDNEAKAPDINNGGSPWFSYSPSEGNFYCCEHNHGMGWPYFCEETWQATWDNGLCVSLYAPTIVGALVGNGNTVNISEITSYPFSDTIQLSVTVTNRVSFPLYVRIPQWCSNSWIQINGQTVTSNCPAHSFECIQRVWANGDQVMLHFPRQITVRTWAANNNCVSVNYGPLTFSLQIQENWQPFGNNAAPWTEYGAYPATPWNYGLILDTNNPAASFTVVTNANGVLTNPFSVNTAPIGLQAQARKIPAWTLDSLYAVGPVQPSPVYSTQAVETINLVPMGAARLRISALPVVSPNPAATRWSAPYSASASYVYPGDTIRALNDALEPASSSDTNIPRMTWWNHTGTAEWVQADFNGLSEVSQISVYWYDDAATGGGCRVPNSWTLEYLAGTNWLPVSGASSYGMAKDKFNNLAFHPVQTTALRMKVQLQSGYSGGILEWQVPAEPVASLAARYPLHGSLVDTVAGQSGSLAGGTFVADRSGMAGAALQFNGTGTNYAVIPRPNWMDWTISYWVKITGSNSGSRSPYSTGGKFGGALYLDGSSTLTTLSGSFPSGVPTGASPYTIAVWEKVEAGCPNNGGFVGWGQNNNGNCNNLRLGDLNGNSDSIDNYWWANDFYVDNLPVNPADGNWHALAATFDGTTRTLYEDGIAVGSQKSSAPNVPGNGFIVGKSTGDANFKGWMENLLIANRAFTPAEMTGYQAGFSNSGSILIPGGTVGYWQFNNPANLGADRSSQGNTLSLNNLMQNQNQWWQGEGLVDGETAAGADDFGTSLSGHNVAFGVGNPDTTITSAAAIDDSQWHHVAATRNALTGLMQLYVDGTLQASATGPFGPKTSPGNLRLGSLQTGVATGFLKGTLSDVQIFDRVLSPAEIGVEMNQAMTASPIADTNLIAGQTLSISNSAVDPYVPPRTLAWTLPRAPVGATINRATGLLTWRPAMAQSATTNLLAVVVSDNGSPSLSTTQTFSVTVRQPINPQINLATLNGGAFQFNVSGNLGPDYIIEATTNLSLTKSWLPIYSNASAVLPFIFTNSISTNIDQEYYRVLLGP